MKQFLKILAVAIAAISLGACKGTKNVEEPPTPPKMQLPVTAKFRYGYMVSNDLFNGTKIDIFFTNADGREVKESMETVSWSKELPEVKRGFVGTMRVVYTLKEDFEPTARDHTFGVSYKLQYKTTANKSELNDKSNSLTLSGNMAKGYLELFVKTPQIYTLEVK